MPDDLLLLKRIFLEFYSVSIDRFLVKGIKAREVFGWNNLNFAEDLFWLIYRQFDSKLTKISIAIFFKLRLFFNLFCLPERKLRPYRLNVINIDIKPLEGVL